jgi:hypothetical protein
MHALMQGSVRCKKARTCGQTPAFTRKKSGPKGISRSGMTSASGFAWFAREPKLMVGAEGRASLQRHSEYHNQSAPPAKKSQLNRFGTVPQADRSLFRLRRTGLTARFRRCISVYLTLWRAFSFQFLCRFGSLAAKEPHGCSFYRRKAARLSVEAGKNAFAGRLPEGPSRLQGAAEALRGLRTAWEKWDRLYAQGLYDRRPFHHLRLRPGRRD